MTIKAKLNVAFPANVTVESPLAIEQTGRNYHITIDASALLGGDVAVWQLRVALKDAGYFDDIENDTTNFSAVPGSKIYELWEARGAWTSYGDSLSNAIAAVIGTANTQAAYSAATAITN